MKSFIAIHTPKMLKAYLCFPQGSVEFCAAANFSLLLSGIPVGSCVNVDKNFFI